MESQQLTVREGFTRFPTPSIHKETEVQRGKVACPRPHSKLGAKLGAEPLSSDSPDQCFFQDTLPLSQLPKVRSPRLPDVSSEIGNET